jgi:flagellin-like protein
MTTRRRAVSPIIATVILIAVAVALGIAVAVWAGALTGSLSKTEKLVINSYTTGSGAAENLVISITNSGAGAITVTQVMFNSVPVTTITAAMCTGAGFTWNSATSQSLLSADTGTITIPVASLPSAPSPGISYPITVVTAAGNSYPSQVTWS